MEAFATIASYSTSAAKALRSSMQEAGPRIAADKIELPYSEFSAALPQVTKLCLRDDTRTRILRHV